MDVLPILKANKTTGANKTVLKTDGEVMTFHRKYNLSQFMKAKPVLQKTITGVLFSEDSFNHKNTEKIKYHERNR